MKKLFWFGILGLLIFEILNVYFIMPMPGSQEMNSIELAYFLFSWRWVFRILFGVMIIVGLTKSKWKRKWSLVIPIAVLAAVVYMANFKMAADHMFYQPKNLQMVLAATNQVDTGTLVIGVEYNGEARAYPIQFLGYHHQVRDTIAGKPIIVTYCTVCRTGRAYEPIVNGKPENFRLVGMDHFNAMFEDESTHSWWRQVNGSAIIGKLKGQQLPEMHTIQTSLAQWLQLNPKSYIMQADPAFLKSYDTTKKYESGLSRNKLTGTDSLSWQKKSWVIGVKSGANSKAYDWNRLKAARLIQDDIAGNPVLIVVSDDDKSFFAFERPSAATNFRLTGNTLYMDSIKYRIDGRPLGGQTPLKPLPAYQEFWHSWQTFNPGTLKD